MHTGKTLFAAHSVHRRWPWLCALALLCCVRLATAATDALQTGDRVRTTKVTRLVHPIKKKILGPVAAGATGTVIRTQKKRALVELDDGLGKGWLALAHLELTPPAESPAAVEADATRTLDEATTDPIEPPPPPPVPAAPPATDPATAAERPLRVAIYDLEAQGVEPRIARAVTDSLASEVRKLSRVSAVSMSEIRDMLTHEENKQLMGCGDDSCLAEIGGALGVDELVSGSLGSVGGSSVITVRRLNLVTAQVVATCDRRLDQGDGEEYLAAIGPLVEQLYPQRPLKDGMSRGVADEVALALNPPPLPRWVFFSSAATAVGLAALGGGAGVVTLTKVLAHNDYAAKGTSTEDPIDGALLGQMRQEAEAWNGVELGLLIASGAVAGGAGLVAIFTDWHGYRDAE